LMKDYNPDASIASWAFRWVASLDNVLVVLSGMNEQSQLDDNISTFSPVKKLNEEEVEILEKVSDLFLKTKSIPCTKCHYCMPCALGGIDIPKVFEIYNSYLIDHDGDKFKKEYLSLTKNGGDCVSCKRCMKVCPQSINIAENMKQIDRSAMSL
ncbi:MAG: aldo/keto reductase, partial [Sphaerochaetaceae bacterium]|nr:aldo/keto reductase [Sphaerochaetaceae bacterium]